jgi:CheY-like chemotaxis protein
MDMTRPRILIVEDDKPTATKFERALTDIGNSRIAEHAEAACFQLIDFEPEVVLLDIWLEGERKFEARSAGISILRAIRKPTLPFAGIPVVVVTGLVDPDVERQCRDLGVTAFLKKPVALETLRQAVQEALAEHYKQRRPTRESAGLPGPDPAQFPQDGKPDTMLTILFLAADPTDASRLRLGQEFREIKERLQLSRHRDRLKLELPQLSARPADVSQALLDTQPQIVHFSGHGTSTGALCFENQAGTARLVQPKALARLFGQFVGQVDCVLLNACYTKEQAKAIARHIDFVIGMSQAISDKAAIAFATGFYQALGAGRTIEQAYELGRVLVELQEEGVPEHLIPVLIKRQPGQP